MIEIEYGTGKPFEDGCPECLNTINLPKTTLVEGDNVRATYRCLACGHAWFCNWSTDFLASPAQYLISGDAA